MQKMVNTVLDKLLSTNRMGYFLEISTNESSDTEGEWSFYLERYKKDKKKR